MQPYRQIWEPTTDYNITSTPFVERIEPPYIEKECPFRVQGIMAFKGRIDPHDDTECSTASCACWKENCKLTEGVWHGACTFKGY